MKSRGFAIITAIFFLLMLGLLGAFVVNMATSQHKGSALDMDAIRAEQAARAGIEWGLYRTMRDADCTTSNLALVPASLDQFTVTVVCNPSGAVAAGAVVTITATACNQPDGGSCPNEDSLGDFYVERRLEATVMRPRL